MTLVAEVLGVLLGGAGIAALLRSSTLASFHRAAGVAVVITAVAAVLFAPNLWSAIRGFATSGSSDQGYSAQAAELAAGAGTNTAFLSWARTKMVTGDRAPQFWLAPATVREDAFTYQWSTYQLLPARQADLMQEAKWIVFYGVNPATIAYDRADFGRVMKYRPGFALAERTSVG